MNSNSTVQIPRSLVEALFNSDKGSNGHPVLSSEIRSVALEWLCRIIADFEALDEHIALLQNLYQSPFKYPRARRDQIEAIDDLDGDSTDAFRHRELLTDDRLTAIADNGVSVLNDDELAKLLLNPFALFDLFDVIDELQPEAWSRQLHSVASEANSVRQAAQGMKPIRVSSVQGVNAAEVPVQGDGATTFIKSLSTALERLDRAAAMPTPSVRTDRGWTRDFALIAASAACALSVVAICFTFLASYQFTSQRIGLVQAPSAREQGATGTSAVELHAGPTRISSGEEIWSSAYSDAFPPAENIQRLKKASGKDLNDLIDELKGRGASDMEILLYLKFLLVPNNRR